MEDVTRKRIMRKLEGLPEEQLYQILDYIEFLELKYKRESERRPDAFQQFAERVEDQLRVRSLAPKAMKGTMRVVSTAGRVLDNVRELGRELRSPLEEGRGGRRPGAAGGRGTDADAGRSEGVAGGPNGASDEGRKGEGGEGSSSP